MPAPTLSAKDATQPGGARRIGGGFVFLGFLMGCVAHCVATDTEVRRVPHWALVLRLPLQVALLALIAWSTFWAGPHLRVR